VGKKLLIYSHSDLQAFSEPASFSYLRYCSQCAASNCNADQQFSFCGEFSPLRNKQKGLKNLTKEILRVSFLNRHILRKKKIEVARFRQCVTAGRQN
jgi:hypothetical protein